LKFDLIIIFEIYIYIYTLIGKYGVGTRQRGAEAASKAQKDLR
jgi:hypothetical protein